MLGNDYINPLRSKVAWPTIPKIVYSTAVTMQGPPEQVGKTVKEILWSLLTFSWVGESLLTKTIVRTVPSDNALVIDGGKTIFVHPAYRSEIEGKLRATR